MGANPLLAEQINQHEKSLYPLFTEIYIGLGDNYKASLYLKSLSTTPHYYLYSAKALLSVSLNKYDDAIHYFKLAAVFIEKDKSNLKQLQAKQWALINVAGMYLDSNRASLSKPYLDLANEINNDNVLLQVHWSEYYQAMGDNKRALTMKALGTYPSDF